MTLTVTTPGHTATLRTFGGGMGDPPEYQSSCTCGWTGTYWDGLYSDLDSPLNTQGFTPEFQAEVAAAGGLRAWTGARGQKFGTIREALAEMKAHVAYDPESHAGQIIAAADQVVAATSAFVAAPTVGSAREVNRVTNTLNSLVAAFTTLQEA
jgi:hypothetical protein